MSTLLALAIIWLLVFATGLKYRSQVTGCRSQVTGYRSQVTGHRSQVTGYRSQVKKITFEGYALKPKMINKTCQLRLAFTPVCLRLAFTLVCLRLAFTLV